MGRAGEGWLRLRQKPVGKRPFDFVRLLRMLLALNGDKETFSLVRVNCFRR